MIIYVFGLSVIELRKLSSPKTEKKSISNRTKDEKTHSNELWEEANQLLLKARDSELVRISVADP